MAAAVTKVEKEVDEYKEDGLKFTINEHILDDEKDIGYDPHEGNLLRSIDNKTVRICNFNLLTYYYSLFFLRSIAQFFTQIYMNCFVSS